MGCEGLPGASDMRDPDVERICCPVGGACPKWFCDVERFMAEAGIGIADALLLIGPSVSRGRRTENMPLSCDMMGVYVVVSGVVVFQALCTVLSSASVISGWVKSAKVNKPVASAKRKGLWVSPFYIQRLAANISACNRETRTADDHTNKWSSPMSTVLLPNHDCTSGHIQISSLASANQR